LPTKPSSGAEWALQGQRQLQEGFRDRALASFLRATELEPGDAMHWGRLGRLLAANWHYDAAEAALRRASSLDPRAPALQMALAEVCVQQNKAEEAIEASRRALASDPDNLHAAVTEALLLPPIYSSTSDLEKWRNRFVEGLERLRANKAHWLSRPRRVLEVETNNFYLPFQGRDDRALQCAYSDFLAALLGTAVPELQAPVARRRDPEGKIKIGFMSSNLRASTIGDYFGSWITDLPRDRFHVSALFTAGAPDARTEAFARASDRFASLPGTAEEVARAAKSLDLDLLVFPDAGISVWGHLLANLRMAPVQCAAWGQPTTTGSAFVDHYLSCASMEPEQAAAHYRERLTLLPGIGTRYRTPQGVANASRAQFGLPEGKRIYLCPQSLYKIHPETDSLFFDLLERDEEAVLVFFAATTSGQRKAFVERLQAGMKARNLAPRQQIKVLPLMSHDDFRRVMSVCDVMLDTLHWSGGNTSLDALACGLPIVTLPGRFMRGRQSAAMLRAVGVDELIARDARDYVEIALRVAGDSGYCESLAKRIREGLPRLFDRSEPIEALADALEGMVRTRPAGT
jgi:CRISPR-associated protein Csy1